MAELHKIPQNVTTYQGRIIGKFTAKQFIFLAIGAIVSFLIFNTDLPLQVKIPVAFVSLGVSVLFAVVNYEGRSTDMWIQGFLGAVYATTQMVWKKEDKTPPYLLPRYHPHAQTRNPRKRSQSELERYLQMRGTRTLSDKFSNEEQQVLEHIRKPTTPIDEPPTRLSTKDQQTDER
ncbi:hypothetical protein CO180_03325 [candidate division WWE3 bacterium CG_4_9_14_3_um_filter_41_6]|uniref:PrgI family protein n=1 Tax=candidate division WWE3 bacterium CG_4_10_14_0_2_um_filter_41_14 TaxID=1975072 RepID=A0A2M7TM67_UNCKA|nr:MAG: hypothetical protein COY32_00130 [candidate division WWE3 bacterium CG_4_10_14_0_2_um_filter_41_14]PJA38538.1 MAG: hypothetical protein CO180_03325 [candidate division WWE3 bacterium CG_4_9_14_3_um_filter_41_6]